jgi:thiamine kinase-like enzyme
MNTPARDRIAKLDFWSTAVEPEPLSGGITNVNFVVDDQDQRFVVRIGDDIPIHGVMRFNELAAARAAHAAGLSPEVVYSEKGLFIIRFIEGKTFGAQDVRCQKNLERIIPLVRNCHTELPNHFQGPALVFWPFHICRSYIHTAKQGNSRLKGLFPRLLEINTCLEKTVGEIKLVFGHNDLLPANFIDDGKRLWLIDWDYAGYNTALFDLANLSSNNELSAEQEDLVLESYYQQPVTDCLRYRFTSMKCVSLLRETLWSIVSEIHSTIDFNYEKYTEENLDRFEKNYKKFQDMN